MIFKKCLFGMVLLFACLLAMSFQLCLTPCDPVDYSLPGSSVHGTWGCHFLFQGIFPTQGLNPLLLHLLHSQAGSLPLVPPGKPKLLITQAVFLMWIIPYDVLFCSFTSLMDLRFHTFWLGNIVHCVDLFFSNSEWPLEQMESLLIIFRHFMLILFFARYV